SAHRPARRRRARADAALATGVRAVPGELDLHAGLPDDRRRDRAGRSSDDPRRRLRARARVGRSRAGRSGGGRAPASRAVRIDRVYTRVGDGGETSLIGGDRVSKADARIDCYGTVDELNAVVGLAIEALAASAAGPHLSPILRRVQNELFNLGCE